MPEMTGKQALLEMLKAEGVEYIFGNPGTSEGPIINLLADYPEFKYILTLQESVAMGMGESFARATQNKASACATQNKVFACCRTHGIIKITFGSTFNRQKRIRPA